MAIVIAGERSGVGKTTVTLALLASLCRRGLLVQSFKVGPDYIDPMFHQHVTGRPCRNLDPVLTSVNYVQQCFAHHTQGVDYALVEGVMGLFDGATGTNDWASTAHVARLLHLPVVLVVDCSRLSYTVAAIVHGYRSFDPQLKLAGVVLNRVGSDRHLELLQAALEPLHLPILGILRRQDNITIPDRHLGLVPTAEITQLNPLIDRLAQLGDSCFDWQHLLPLLKSPTSSPYLTIPSSPHSPPPLRLAIARDRAFSFYYQDNLDLLQQLGAQLIPWSPLSDRTLPENIQGLYFGGGFPEVFAQQLAENYPIRAAVRAALQSGIPTYAECGGLMYLCQQIVDFDGKAWAMIGAIPTIAVMSSRLTLGYRQATALQDSPLLNAGTKVWGHEFHRSRLTEIPMHPLFQIRGYEAQSSSTLEGWQLHNIHASYVHLHFGERLEIPRRFLQHCASFSVA
ncbi:MAG: cobyrinate a,c-diamide synthase [Chroococcidiopsidaceae cyanobacterium CP_BM_ER_R8_30]|nr:cobyrinate a,c-diamide synthase [Chroococcidiopsidaceae cyanobacterium CP_BM_ER_R8_30]